MEKIAIKTESDHKDINVWTTVVEKMNNAEFYEIIRGSTGGTVI